MTLIAIKDRGSNKAKARCDSCGKEVTFSCRHEKTEGGKRSPNQADALAKLIGLGWTDADGALQCDECSMARAAKDAAIAKVAKGDIRQPTRAERREIADLLSEVYDVDAERYKGSDTDDSIAEVIGVMPGWVAAIREDMFGPSGENEDMVCLEAQLADFRKQADERLLMVEAATDALRKSVDQAASMSEQLRRIKAAVGQRISRRV
ncbi:hypothetical protein AAD018_013820 [Aestuariibius insulae]|uniref:hypothetical protein n=1 Tax=Aestuariibius insulae TaxID=2058287 RepID=UPI00345EA477